MDNLNFHRVLVDNLGNWVVLYGKTKQPENMQNYWAKYLIGVDDVDEVTTRGPALFVRGEPVPPYLIGQWICGEKC